MTRATRTSAIIDRIGHAIDEGLLQPGRRMPSLRGAAEEYGVSKNTMVDVYDRLVALEGFARGHNIKLERTVGHVAYPCAIVLAFSSACSMPPTI